MKITMVVATSRDGFINHLGQKHAYEWTSPEDHKFFASVLARYKLLLMGRNTYEANKDGMKHSSLHRRIVFTRDPSEHKTIPGILEFTDEPIPKVIEQLQNDGFNHAILLGGGVLFTEFLDLGLVDEVNQTIEPLTFGEGIPFLLDGHTLNDYPYLHIESTKTLNEAGTRQLHYVRN